MEFIPLSLCCLVFLIYHASLVQGQNCLAPTLSDVSFVTDDILDTVTASQTDSTIYDFNISCLSAGTIRNRYRLATVIMNFTTNSNYLQNEGCLPNTDCLSYLELSCNQDTNVWQRNEIFITVSFTVDFNAPRDLMSPRMDCGSCGVEISIPQIALATFDNLTHCFECDPTCYNQGLNICRALTNDRCCNFYEDNLCVGECSERRIATAATNFSCVCNNSFTGPNCNTCNLNCSQNGVLNTQYCFCVCSAGFFGERCESFRIVDVCEGVNCQNGGTCQPADNNFVCVCATGFEGRFCENNTNECLTANCNNGTCIDEIGGFTCNCSLGYTGSDCSQLVDNCMDNPCLNGNCINLVNNFTCNCFENFSGRRCDVCNLANCQNCSTLASGTCITCRESFFLIEGRCQRFCETFMPCQNGGTCNDINVGNRNYNCQCSPGFFGTNCTERDPCSPNPCNGGACERQSNRMFNCTCGPNNSGERCENCQISNCQNCSLTVENKCDVCNAGYIPGNSTIGGCVIDLSVCDKPYTNIHLPLCKWRRITDACSFDLLTSCLYYKRSSAMSKSRSKLYNSHFDCYKNLHDEWRARAEVNGVIDSGATALRHKKPDRDWRNAFNDAVKSLTAWIDYYKRTFPGVIVPDIPNLELGSNNEKAVYDRYIRYWSSLLTQFNNEVVPTDNC